MANKGTYIHWQDLLADLADQPSQVFGAWVRMLAALNNSKTVGKDTKTVAEWSRIINEDCGKTVDILCIIKEKGIGNVRFFSNPRKCNALETIKVTVCNRRMVRDEKARKAGRLRVQKHRRKQNETPL